MILLKSIFQVTFPTSFEIFPFFCPPGAAPPPMITTQISCRPSALLGTLFHTPLDDTALPKVPDTPYLPLPQLSPLEVGPPFSPCYGELVLGPGFDTSALYLFLSLLYGDSPYDSLLWEFS